MTVQEINKALATHSPITICPWTTAFSNECLVTAKSVAGNRTVTYTWEGQEEGQLIEKTSQVSWSTWNYIIESLGN